MRPPRATVGRASRFQHLTIGNPQMRDPRRLRGRARGARPRPRSARRSSTTRSSRTARTCVLVHGARPGTHPRADLRARRGGDAGLGHRAPAARRWPTSCAAATRPVTVGLDGGELDGRRRRGPARRPDGLGRAGLRRRAQPRARGRAAGRRRRRLASRGMSSEPPSAAAGRGLATVDEASGATLDTWYPAPALGLDAPPVAAACRPRSGGAEDRGVRLVPVTTVVRRPQARRRPTPPTPTCACTCSRTGSCARARRQPRRHLRRAARTSRGRALGPVSPERPGARCGSRVRAAGGHLGGLRRRQVPADDRLRRARRRARSPTPTASASARTWPRARRSCTRAS